MRTKRKNRLLSLALSLCLLLSVLPISGMTYAAEQTACPNHTLHDDTCDLCNIQDKTPAACTLTEGHVGKCASVMAFGASSKAPTSADTDISWYDSNALRSSYEIHSAAQLAGLAELVNAGNDFSGTMFTLTANLDLNNQEWMPIGKGYMDWDAEEASLGFSGIFDGGGHTVTGLSITVNSAASNTEEILGGAGLFGFLLGGTVKNLTVYGTVNVQNYGVWDMGNDAGIVGFCADGTVENCINYATIVGASYTGGGIVGYNDGGIITKCTNYGTVSMSKGAGQITGGVVGYSVNGEISYCHNAGAVSYSSGVGAGYAGGILGSGEWGQPNTIQSCYNSGTVSSNYSASWTGQGGICGSTHYVTIKDCYNSGLVSNTSQSPATCGAIGGNCGDTSIIMNCYYLDTSCGQGYSEISSSVSPGTIGITTKTSEELKDISILQGLNKTSLDWGFAEEVDFPVLLFTLPADYTAVDEAITRANALNKNDYKDFSAVEAAINAVIRGKNAAEQADVGEMKNAIEDAIAGLIKKEIPSTSSSTPPVDIPQTGDTATLWPWAFLMLAALTGCGALLFYRKRRVREK